MMEDRLRELLHCEEKLRNSLHANDTEKLRQKLELLQREHRRTSQRLRRAEHLDSVRGHIRNKITPHSHDQTNEDIKPCSSVVEQKGTKEPFPDMVQKPQLSPGVAIAINNTKKKKSQAIGALLLSDMAYTPTSNSSQDFAQIPKASPTLRLRSRRSRIRLAKRSGHSDQSSTNSLDTLKETENVRREEEKSNTIFLNKATILQESEELFSPCKDESPSLLLTHWNLQGQVEKDKTGNQKLTHENKIDLVSNCEQKQLNSASKLLENKAVSPFNDNRSHAKLQDICEKSKKRSEEMRKQDESEKTQKAKNPDAEFKMEKAEHEDDSRPLLDSCTLVEGLLFPAEYYVRTTRRMAVSRSQPDMNAIILSHLSRGRPRRGRVRGRPLNRTVSVDGESVREAYKRDSENNSSSFCELSTGISCSLNGGVSSAVATPGRGRRGRRARGRGAGRAKTPRGTAKLNEDMKENTNDDISLAVSPPMFNLSCEEAVPEDVLTKEACRPAAGVAECEQVQTLNGSSCPSAVRQNNQRWANGLQKNAENWPSLLLPSLSQGSVPPLSPLPPVSLLQSLLCSHVQDFHLPDDQFAFLKLLKLQQITDGVEQFTPYNARNRSAFSPQLKSLSLSPTPGIGQNDFMSVSQTDEGKLAEEIIDSNDGEIDVPSQDKREVVCPCPKIKRVANGTNPSDQIKVKVLSQDCKKTSKTNEETKASVSMGSVVQNEPEIVTSIGALAENLAGKKFRIAQNSKNQDKDCLPVANTILEKGNQDLESHVPSETNDKTDSLLENSCSEDNSEYPYNRNHPTQLLLSPSLESASCPLMMPHLGFTPQMTLMKSPHTPRDPHFSPVQRPISEVLSPHPASPLRSRPPSLPLTSPSHLGHDHCEAPSEPSERGEGQLSATVQRCGEETKNCMYTLKAPAGGSLVDVCCVPSSSGPVWLAAAGTWAVCLWRSQDHSSDWSLSHTWSFQEPVISVFPIPDFPDLFCVTLGQLEIRQVRVLSCCSLSQIVLCDCVVQTAMGAPNCKVVCSSNTSTTSIIRVFTLSDHTSAPHCLPLVSPGGALSSLASVEGLPDALIGTDESGSLLIWNMKTGHLLQKVTLGDGLSHSACLQGYSHSGALFALLQHQSLGSVRNLGEGLETKVGGKALFFLLAINPRNGKSALAAHLCPPDDWSDRLCEVDVLGCRLVGLSQSGSVCVWDLEHPGDPPWAVDAPHEEGCHLARWGGKHILLTALHTGDVTLHRYIDT